MDLAEMVVRFADGFSVAMWRFLFVLGTVVGVLYAGGALLRMQQASALPGHNPVGFGGVLGVLVVGALLANLSTVIDAVWHSFGTGGTVTYGPVSYEGAADFGRLKDAVNAVLTIAGVAGGIFFFRGLLLLKKSCMDGHSSSAGEDTVWRAVVHMICGALLVQMPDFFEAVRQSFGLYW
jgi:hypothetical protein